MRHNLLFILLILVVSGCNLTQATESGLETPALTDEPIQATATSPSSTTTPSSETTTSSSETATPLSDACTVRSDWPVHMVTRGDTLIAIGERTGASVEELVAANCLENPDKLFVGQLLHVPSLPGDGLPVITQTYIGPYGFAFDYPARWHIQDIPGGPVTGVNVSSFPFDNEPPEAAWTSGTVWISFAYVPPALAPDTLEAWVQQEKQQFAAARLDIFSEENILLRDGLPAVRLTLVSGSGHVIIQVYTIMNGRHILVSGRGDVDLFNQTLSTLRPT